MKVTYSLYYNSKKEFHETEVEEISVCPLCHSGGHPHFDGGYIVSNHEGKTGVHLFIILYCTVCKEFYIAKYFGTAGNFKLEYALPSNSQPVPFDDIISDLSPDFVSIFNQAKQAEELGLTELVGIWYRKSLEFLVKDYLIKFQNENPETIKSTFLGNCIEKIKDDKILTLAKGATWLGNDETHYEKRHKDYGIEHIKLFIKTLVQYIIGEESFKQAQQLINSKK